MPGRLASVIHWPALRLILVSGLAAFCLWTYLQLQILGIRNAFLRDSLEEFCVIAERAEVGEISYADAIEGIRTYYPRGSRLAGAEVHEQCVERVRQSFLTSLERRVQGPR